MTIVEELRQNRESGARRLEAEYKAIDTLPRDQREAIALHYFMDMPVAQIAKYLSVPNGTVLSRLHYARKALAAKLGAKAREAAKKPGAKALLVVLALGALTALGAAIAGARAARPQDPKADEPSALRQEAPPPTSPPSGGPTSLGDAAPNLAAPAAQPSNQTAEASPQPLKWPLFTLTGIAVGRERLAILNTGEMLLSGETAKNGVKVKEVNASTVVFAWGGETKTLRKGEHSDKPAD
jgi:hypothetical protein